MIQLKPIEQKNTLGSLLDLFQCQYFTMEMLLQYLNKKFEEIGTHDYLVNKLYQMKQENVEFYMAQLIYLVIKRESAPLERFLLDFSCKDIVSFLRVYWLLRSYGQANKDDKHKIAKVNYLLKCCELSMVYGKRIEDVNVEQDEKLSLKQSMKNSQSFMIQDHKERQIKKEYENYSNHFFNIMIQISLTLKSIPMQDRKMRLLNYIKMANSKLSQVRQMNADEKVSFQNTKEQMSIYNGLFFPFSQKNQGKYKSNYIVNILEESFACFNTKKRVPYKIVLEVIDINDLLCYRPKKTNDNVMDEIKYDKQSIFDDWSITDDIKDIKEVKQQNPQNQIKAFNDLKYFAKKVQETETAIKQKLQNKNKFFNYFNIKSYICFDQEEHIKNHKLFQEELLQNQSESDSFTLNTMSPKMEIESLEFNKKLTNFNFKSSQSLFTVNQILKQHKSLQLISKEKIQIQKRSNSCQKIKIKNFDVLNHLQQQQNINIEKIKQIETYLKQVDEKEERQNFEIEKIEPWGDIWASKSNYIRMKSPYGHFPSYQLKSIIVKGGDDLRQELLAMQLIQKFQEIFEKANVNLYLRPYEITVISDSSGFIEFCCNTMSLDGIKKQPNFKNLKQFFQDTFGDMFQETQKNFVESLAAYSLVSYLLQFKDRHNGNILLDSEGHLIHIDFGFMLSISPGGINFENAPFKLTSEYVDLMDGKDSELYNYYKILMFKGFMELRKYVTDLVLILELMMEESDLPCFAEFDLVLFRSRFKELASEEECMEYVNKLISLSLDNWRTLQYDRFQKITNGIAP